MEQLIALLLGTLYGLFIGIIPGAGATTGLIADFTVSDNGSSIFCSETGDGAIGGCRNIMFDSGPFKVEFTVVE